MNWLPVSQWLQQHCHLVWKAFHFVHANLPVALFIVFGVAGLAQAYLAIDAGGLAVDALPEVSLTAKRLHKRKVLGVGVLLAFSTILIALLNDKNQSDSDERARKATATLTDIASQANASNLKFQEFVSHFDWSKLSQGQRKDLDRVQAQLQRTASAATAAVNTLAPTPPSPKTVAPAAPTALAPEQATPFSEEERKQLRKAADDAQSLIDSLKRQDTDAQNKLNDLVTKWMKENVPPGTRDSDALPYGLPNGVMDLVNRTPSYDEAKINNVLGTYQNCCLAQMMDSGFNKFATFRNGDYKGYGGSPFPQTVGALRTLRAETTISAQGLLVYMKDRLLQAAATGLPIRD